VRGRALRLHPVGTAHVVGVALVLAGIVAPKLAPG
jgi:hypothetical protein